MTALAVALVLHRFECGTEEGVNFGPSWGAYQAYVSPFARGTVKWNAMDTVTYLASVWGGSKMRSSP